MYYAIDSVFQPPIFMISSTAAPVRNVLGEPHTRKKYIMKWFSSSPANKWPCRAAVIRAAERGRRSRKPLSRNHGERVPGGLVRSNTLCGRDVLRDRPGRANRRAIPVCEPDHYLPRGPKRPTKPKVEDQTLRRLGLLDLQTQCKRKGRNPYTTKLTPTSIGLRLSSQRYGSQGGSHPCTRPRVAAKTHDRVLQQRCRPIDPDLLLRLGHDCEVRICRWAQARIGCPAVEVPFFPFPCYFIACFNLEANPLRIESVA